MKRWKAKSKNQSAFCFASADKEEVYSMQKKCRNTELDDEFIEKKKEIMKRKMVQRKENRRLLAAKNKQLRKSKKVKHEKEDKKVIWLNIRELNSNFA